VCVQLQKHRSTRSKLNKQESKINRFLFTNRNVWKMIKVNKIKIVSLIFNL